MTKVYPTNVGDVKREGSVPADPDRIANPRGTKGTDGGQLLGDKFQGKTPRNTETRGPHRVLSRAPARSRTKQADGI